MTDKMKEYQKEVEALDEELRHRGYEADIFTISISMSAASCGISIVGNKEMIETLDCEEIFKAATNEMAPILEKCCKGISAAASAFIVSNPTRAARFFAKVTGGDQDD